jgi:hypothetical protein
MSESPHDRCTVPARATCPSSIGARGLEIGFVVQIAHYVRLPRPASMQDRNGNLPGEAITIPLERQGRERTVKPLGRGFFDQECSADERVPVLATIRLVSRSGIREVEGAVRSRDRCLPDPTMTP